jgi:hypothetical protein
MGKTSIYRNAVMDAKLGPLEARHGGLSSAVTILADRYVELMARERRVLRELFSEGERDLMLNNALSTAYEPGAVIPGAVLADTEDEEASVLEAFGVDRAAILAKLRGLNLGQQFALVDWLEELREAAGATPPAAEN